MICPSPQPQPLRQIGTTGKSVALKKIVSSDPQLFPRRHCEERQRRPLFARYTSFAGSSPTKRSCAKAEAIQRSRVSPLDCFAKPVIGRAFARGMPGWAGVPVVTMLVCLYFFAHEAAGAAGIRHSLRPLSSGGMFGKARARNRAAGMRRCGRVSRAQRGMSGAK